jgi:hypothetical protein
VVTKTQEPATVKKEGTGRHLDISVVKRERMELSISVRDRPMSLLYQAAVDKLNELLAVELGPNAIQQALESELDISPEATAQRIVDLSTNLFDAFKEQHADLSDEEALDLFMETIGSGIEQGFAEAREILDGLGVLQGEIATNVDLTYEQVQEGLASFREGMAA